MQSRDEKVNFMKKKFLGKVLMMASFIAILGGFSSCKDYSEDRYSDLLSKLENQNITLEEALNAQKEELLKKIAELEAAQKACKEECRIKMEALEAQMSQMKNEWNAALAGEVATLEAVDENLQDQIDAIKAVIGENTSGKTLVEQISDVNTVATEAAANAAEALKKLETINATTADFEKRISALEVWKSEVEAMIVGWDERMKAVEAKAAAAEAQASLNKAAIEKMIAMAEARGERIDSIINAMSDLDDAMSGLASKQEMEVLAERMDSVVNALGEFATKNELDEVKALAEENLEAAKEYVDFKVTALQSKVNKTIATLKENMEAANEALREDLEALEEKVNALEDKIEANSAAIGNLTGAFNKLITSVVLQGTKNPVMGSVATPFNTRSNILAAYYGEVGAAGLEFPTDLPRYYVDGADIQMTYEDILMLEVEPITEDEGIVLLAGEGNAGKLYMTVNPNTVDFTGVEFTLVNSQDEWSGAELSSIKPSDEVLSFGVSRAVKNGFYEASATIAEDQIEDLEFSVNLEEIKDVAEDIFNGGGVEIGKVANTVANFMASFVMDANGVKASWEDYEGEHSTYSQYGVAVTAVKPLSYSFGKDFNFTKVPGLDRIENFIGNVTQKTKNAIAKLDKVFDIELVEIKHISMPEIVDGKYILEVTVNVPETTDESGTVTIPAQTFVQKIDATDLVKDIFADMEGSFDDVNKMLDELQNVMTQVNDILQAGKDLQASANSYADKFQSKLTEYLNNFNNKFCNLINSTNKAIRPVLLVNTDKGFHKLSQALNNPTVISGTNLIFTPTSYTLEYLAPAYKKLVGVTNVYKGTASAQGGDAACKAALDKVNAQEGIAEILSGDTYDVEASFEPGYVYEIVYTAVDFYGMVDAKKFYVTVK